MAPAVKDIVFDASIKLPSGWAMYLRFGVAAPFATAAWLRLVQLANAICQCVNDDVRPIDAGKPSMLLLEYLRRPLEEGGCGIDFSRAVMIGDSLNTDVELANKAGMKSLLVLSGVSSQEDLHHETDPLRQPTWVVSSFANT
eukprot:TRINITY_DN4670_c0_g1_i1.p1 TRINITY_DN4670_c0_g1~~TRINITY_DN4670_c0_g1_i1.p1  ORF type:complete len:142 (+),score=26.82 TRINITY_DN4670_c0_g1_i1:18-443(+)